MKYVTFEQPDGSRFPVVFPEHIDHSMITRAMQESYPGIKPSSAGFCCVGEDEKFNPCLSVYGKSQTLGLEPDREDHFYLQKMLGD